MTHFYERNIVEIKNEYTSFLTNIMAPLIYEGIKKIYIKAKETEKQFNEAIATSNANVTNPGILKLFQFLLKGLKNLNNYKIEAETNRIREASKCAEWFDGLVKAVVKSYIVLLTYNASEKKCRLVNEKYHESIDINSFVHKCYVESARIFYNYPELFWDGFSTVEIKRNQREAYDLIKVAITEAIRKMLPMKLVLEEYLKNDYITDDNEISEHIPQSRYHNVANLVNYDLNNINKIIDTEDDYVNEEIEKIERDTYDKNINNNMNVKEDINKLHEIVEDNKNVQEHDNNNNNNQIHDNDKEVFAKKDNGFISENIDVDNKDTKFLAEPVAIRGNKTANILKEHIETYKKHLDHNRFNNPNLPNLDNNNNNNADSDDVQIDIKSKNKNVDKSKFYDNLVKN